MRISRLLVVAGWGFRATVFWTTVFLATAPWLTALAGEARADAIDGESRWLREYRVADGCPERRIFRDWVERRLSVPLEQARAGTRLAISIDRVLPGGGFAGTIDVADAASRTTRRVVGTGSCPEVAEALSLIAALGLEPHGEAAVPVPRVPPEGPQPPSQADSGAPSRPAPVEAGAPRYEVLALGLVHGAAAPAGALGGGVAAGLEWSEGWQPALQMAVYRVASGDLSFAGGTAAAHFSLVAAQGALCPTRYPSTGPWALRPCLELELGRLSGTSAGAGVIGATTKSGVWTSAGLGLRADADVVGPLRISLLGSGVVPFTRHDFTFSPDATLVFRVPAFGWQASAFAGIVF